MSVSRFPQSFLNANKADERDKQRSICMLMIFWLYKKDGLGGLGEFKSGPMAG